MSSLLKYARARDHADFQWRVAAAMTLKAQAEALDQLAPSVRSLTNWVLNHPMEWQETMVAFVATDPAVSEGITLNGDAVDTSSISDEDIIEAVNKAWELVATILFPAPVVVPPPADPATAVEWQVGMNVTVGFLVTYLKKTYRARQAHTTQIGWTPLAVPSLWELVV